MHRIASARRANMVDRARETGFDFLTIEGDVYWDETAYYAFSLREIEREIEDPTNELAALCNELVAKVVKDDALLRRLAIPEDSWPLIKESYDRGDPSLYGRFDFSFDGQGPAKLLEFNADTPTALFEASVFQWHWLEDLLAEQWLPSGSDQFNSLHEALISRFRAFSNEGQWPHKLHLACVPDSSEDRGLISYMQDCAIQAGLQTATIAMADIGSRDTGPFLDLGDQPIGLLFKLYPWEWMLREPFSKAAGMRETRFVEPPWKTILSNKGILPLLWQMEPGHPNLLEAYFNDDPAKTALAHGYAKKPLYSREGSNIVLIDGGDIIDSDYTGPYGQEGHILQALATLPNFDGNYPVIGSWVIGEKAHGIGIREDRSPITKDTSRFIPHAILP